MMKLDRTGNVNLYEKFIYLLTSEEEQPVLLRKNGVWTLASIAYDIFI
jgi:hypothetical protein